jgi:HEAT repeat protein
MMNSDQISKLIALLDSNNWLEIEIAINALVIAGEPAIPLLLAFLKKREPSAVYVMRVLSGMQATETALHILPYIDDEYLRFREEAWYALAKLKYFDNAEPIIARLPDEESFDVREAMAYALGEIGGDAAIAQLIQLLNDEQSFVVEAASESLIALGDESVPTLLEGLKSEDLKIRHEIHVTLSLIMDRITHDRPMKWPGDRVFLLNAIKAFDVGDEEEAHVFRTWALQELER